MSADLSGSQEHSTTSAFFASQGAASAAMNRLARAGFHDHEIHQEPVAGGGGVRVSVRAQGDRLGHAMRVLDDDELIRRDEQGWREHRGGGWMSGRAGGDWHLPDLGVQGGMGEMVRQSPLMALGLTFVAGLMVGMLTRRV